jgi:hypothetical protein
LREFSATGSGREFAEIPAKSGETCETQVQVVDKKRLAGGEGGFEPTDTAFDRIPV